MHNWAQIGQGRHIHQQYRSCIKSNHSKQYNLSYIEYEIGAVISAVKGKNLSTIIPKHIEYLYIPAVDHESFDLSEYFKMSNQLLS
jgi:hypothetical protein